MCWKDCLQASTYIAAIVAAILSLYQYRRNSLHERTKWLFELYQRFYGQLTFRDMRVRLDERKTDFLHGGEGEKLLPELDDFLNFFEFIAFLQRRKEIKSDEIVAMFSYPLQTIGKNPDVMSYVREYDYGELDRLLKDLGYVS